MGAFLTHVLMLHKFDLIYWKQIFFLNNVSYSSSSLVQSWATLTNPTGDVCEWLKYTWVIEKAAVEEVTHFDQEHIHCLTPFRNNSSFRYVVFCLGYSSSGQVQRPSNDIIAY
jgi:hypothetical protein